MLRTLTSSLFVLALVGCQSAVDPDTFGAEADPQDFIDVPDDWQGKADAAPSRFDKNTIVYDDWFGDSDYVDAAMVQAFFEDTPYGTRSFLADYKIGDRTAAELVVEAAVAHGINPMLLVTRMQGEQGLVAKTVKPSAYRLDRAFGCGCPDGSSCMRTYSGFDKQLDCAAGTLQTHYQGSVGGAGKYVYWDKGVSGQTLDPLWVKPSNHATAALYTYTPWVSVGAGGNWLGWMITREYERHLATLRTPEPPAE